MLGECVCSEPSIGLLLLNQFIKEYSKAWCSQDAPGHVYKLNSFLKSQTFMKFSAIFKTPMNEMVT